MTLLELKVDVCNVGEIENAIAQTVAKFGRLVSFSLLLPFQSGEGKGTASNHANYTQIAWVAAVLLSLTPLPP